MNSIPSLPERLSSLQRNLNSALHGAGSEVDTGNYSALRQPRRDYGNSSGRVTNGPTEKQLAFFNSLLAERGIPQIEAFAPGTSRKGASEAIDGLLKAPKAPQPPSQPSQPSQPTGRPATEKQIRFILKLQGERGVPQAEPEGLTTREASAVIDELLAMPKVKDRRIDLQGVPEGRYAVETEEGHLAFYNLTERGVFVQASDALHLVPGAAAEQAIIAKIAADPSEASRAYGREIGACGVCGRTLTNEHSREEGIGPICSGKMGW